MKGGELVLKTDGLGRVKTPTARRESLLDEFERSGLSGAKFAALTGIKYQTFAAWALRRRKQNAAPAPAKVPAAPADPVRWLEAVLAPVATNPGSPRPLPVILQLPGGARLELADGQQVVLAAALLRALAQPATPC
jgi:hypothetical protein